MVNWLIDGGRCGMTGRFVAKGQSTGKKLLLNFLDGVRANANGIFNRYITMLTDGKLHGQIAIGGEHAIDFV